jgi:hypothetical protein
MPTCLPTVHLPACPLAATFLACHMPFRHLRLCSSTRTSTSHTLALAASAKGLTPEMEAAARLTSIKILSEILTHLDYLNILRSSAVCLFFLQTCALLLTLTTLLGLQASLRARLPIPHPPLPHRASSRRAHRWSPRWARPNDGGVDEPAARAMRSMVSTAPAAMGISCTGGALPCVRAR